MYKRTVEESDFSSDVETDYKGVLVLAGRGISNRLRHLHDNLFSLVPYSRKDQKIDTRKDLRVLGELAELSCCSYIILLESRNSQEYLWIGKRQTGPTVRLSLTSFSTCEELGVLGNFFKNTKFILNSSIKKSPEHITLLSLLLGVFCGDSKDISSDKSLSIYEHAGMLLMRYFHCIEENATEAGPRLSFHLDIIMKGCFSGEIIFRRT